MARKNKKKVFENVEVIDAGAKGKAIAKAPDGKVIFLENAVPGDVGTVQTYQKRKAYYRGKIIQFDQYSPKRMEPDCKHFEYCGGCKWQHMQYDAQVYYKEKEVLNNLERIGKVKIGEILPIVKAGQPYWYRNKMEFSFSDKRWLTSEEIIKKDVITDNHALGFHIAGMWDKILDIEKCHLQKDPSNQIRNQIKQFAVENGLPFFNLREQTGLLRNLMIRTSTTGEIMVVVQFFKNDLPNIKLLLDFIKNRFPEITSLQYLVNSKANDTIYDQKVICYHGKDFITEEMEGLTFKVNAKSFYQTNSQQAYELYKVVREFAQLTGKENVYDLYTGTGTIAQFIAANASKVIGIESVPEAIEDAKENAKINAIENIDFFVGDMAGIFTPEFINKKGIPDVIITDPPRDGMHKKVVLQLLNIEVPRIVYVSCNSATQARDLEILKQKYKVVKSQAVDMFPQTHHVENVVLLELNR
ncbi:MAG: 23S rRNA (uracil(1939)-C(5))-methyltransferase RlmD [Flavobacteriales bacterium]|nr:MAG: 23S rRNA (uracil(1939)-C(5))-methyltransferase RlmD [Flavobacteriales bacterium]PIE49266.1 MAG: 23S rRNA (uracil(1939)-C(5))-methyltransferase RlmD [Flavobacteriales bacterium]